MRASVKQYAKVLYELTEGKTKPEIEKSVAFFARHIYRERKLKLSEKIIEQFGKIYNQKSGIIEAEIVTRKNISEALEKKVKHFVEDKYGAKEVILKNAIDEDIKGGMIVKVGDEILDGSIAGRLGELKNILVK